MEMHRHHVINVQQPVEKLLYVVGDKFTTFAHLDNVITVSQLFANLSGMKNTPFKKHIFVLGQGVSKEEKEILRALSGKKKIGSILNAKQRHASSELTHKHKVENIMVTDPEEVISKKHYSSYMVIDDDCAEMSDHLTGQHIQGMVLTEAARQMMIAVAEKYILTEAQKGSLYCVLTSIQSYFLGFAFPIDISIEHTVLELKHVNFSGYEVKTRTSFIQNGKITAYVDIDYKFQNKKILSTVETQLAQHALSHRMNEAESDIYFDKAA